jgi:uncharacterized protein
MHKLNVLIIGGTGFIGRTLSSVLLGAGNFTSVLSRNRPPNTFDENNILLIQDDVSKPGVWQEKLQEYEVIINLTGASIFRRWSASGKQEIINSRISTTSNIDDAILKKPGVTKLFISVSGVGYYGFRDDELVDENTPAGSDFIAQVAARWEFTAQSVQKSGVRLIVCRFGHVLGRHGGALPKLVNLTRLHLASHWGSGLQWISWIHEKDLAKAILFLIDTPSVSGPVNISSPYPVRNRELMRALTKTLGSRALIPPVSEFALELLLGQFSSVFINGQKVIPGVLIKNGFISNSLKFKKRC